MRSVRYHIKDRNFMKILKYMGMDSFTKFEIRRKYTVYNLGLSIKDGGE